MSGSTGRSVWPRTGIAGLLTAGFGLLVWAAVGSTWRDSSGRFETVVCVPVACAVAAVLLAAGGRTRYRRAASWGALLLVGQAAALQLVEAGTPIHYQHYPPLPEMWRSHPWLLATLALLAGFVLVGWWRAARDPETSPTEAISRWRIGLALLLSFSTAATVSADVRRYLGELGFAAGVQALFLVTLVLAVRALPAHPTGQFARLMDRLGGAPDDGRRATWRDVFPWVAAAPVILVTAALSIFSYQRHPHVPEEVPYLIQARYFAAGMVTMPAPPVPDAFDVDLMYYEPTRWYSPVPPGWPAVLAIGTYWGVPWMVNPVLAGICVVLTYVFLGFVYSRRTTRFATTLFAVSPWVLFLGMSYMTHLATLATALVAAIGVSLGRARGRFLWGLVAGLGLGATSLIRPLDGAIAGMLLGLWALGIGGSRLQFAPMLGLAIGTVALGSLVFPYNSWLTGDPLNFPVNAYFDRYVGKNSNAYGFGVDRGAGWAIDPNPGHSPVDGLINTDLNAFGLNTDLFGWSTGSLILLAWFLVSGRIGRPDRIMIAIVVAVVGAYFPYYFSGGPDFGARYWFLVVLPLVALTARGLEEAERRVGWRANAAVGMLIVAALVNFVPWRAIDKYRDFRGMRADIRALAREHGFDGDLVLVKGARFPDYASAIVYNPLDLNGGGTIYAWDRSPAVRAEVLRAYSTRRVWLVDGPSVTGGPYRVSAGPLSASPPTFGTR